MAQILIAALGCAAYSSRRERCLRTWVPEALKLGMDVVFLIGNGEGPPRREGLLLHVPCPDDYPSLPFKVRLGFEWALQHTECDFVFKCDDDTYIWPERLLALAESGVDYIGAEWSPGVGYASGGAGYLLSRRSLTIAAEGLLPSPQGAEDVLVGQCLSKAGITFQIDQRLVAFGNEELRPRCTNAIITTHACDPPWKTHRVERLGERPVVSCNLMGRLGNNLFQVAAALGFSAKFGTHDAVFSHDAFGHFPPAIFRNLRYGEIPTEHMPVGDPANFAFNEKIPASPDRSVVFCGYAQSEKYFSHCQELIRRTFAPPGELVAELYVQWGDVLRTCTASLHVRRGDYLHKPQYHPVQTAEYYLGALTELSQRAKIQHVLCFSDDPHWCREHLLPQDSRLILVEGQDDYHDLVLMSLCHHHIIANSSFSWWGAWLGHNPTKIVIAPDVHFGPAFVGYSERDLYPAGWMRLADFSVQNGVHTHGYWITQHANEHHAFDSSLCRELTQVFREEGGTVVDLGCGPGRYVQSLRDAGIRCDGFDGNPRTAEFTAGTCRVLDLSRPLHDVETYDWVLSLEVGEHIPRSHEETFLNNLHRHNTVGIVLSWAVEGQGGHGHVNERSNQHIRNYFRSRGYVADIITERRLRESVTNCSWFRNTIMVFRRTSREVGFGIPVAEIRRLVGHDHPVILELGCNDGSDTQRFLKEFPGACVHCFEPDPRPLERFSIHDPRCTLHRLAISAEDGLTDFYLSGGTPPDLRMADWDLSSSIHPPTGHLSAHPWCRFDRKISVPTRSLDSWMSEHPEITMIDFLWADIQGAEGDLIQGGLSTLRNRTRFFYTECYESAMYAGQPTRQEILKLLPDFECIGVYEGYNILLMNLKLAGV